MFRDIDRRVRKRRSSILTILIDYAKSILLLFIQKEEATSENFSRSQKRLISKPTEKKPVALWHASIAQEASLNENAGSAIPIRSNDNTTEVEASSNIGAKNFETTSCDYCELEVVATGRMQSDSQYEQLDHRSNYEPLIIYEQLQEMSAV